MEWLETRMNVAADAVALSFTVPDLKDWLQSKGLSTAGAKRELIRRPMSVGCTPCPSRAAHDVYVEREDALYICGGIVDVGQDEVHLRSCHRLAVDAFYSKPDQHRSINRADFQNLLDQPV